MTSGGTGTGWRDGLREIQGGELIVGDVGGPVGLETEVFAVLEPIGDLLDGGLFEVVGERSLAGGGGRAGEDVIVFTHDLAFFRELASRARFEQVEMLPNHIQSTTTRVGMVHGETPWDAMPLKERLTKLAG
jgi:hypothetical protein